MEWVLSFTDNIALSEIIFNCFINSPAASNSQNEEKQAMEKKNPFKALLLLLMIPCQLAAGALFIAFGAYLDSNILFPAAAENPGNYHSG